ncbi:phage head morphogenesis protein [Campylobacter sp. 2018MI01]|nr:phage head morphogenesis protein [Campylobacter sp. 2018MI01]
MDNRVRVALKVFYGLILPKEHSFWLNNYPPNSWGCRCKTQVLSLDEAKDNEAINFYKIYYFINIFILKTIQASLKVKFYF